MSPDKMTSVYLSSELRTSFYVLSPTQAYDAMEHNADKTHVHHPCIPHPNNFFDR
jgi:hypothetical protein